LNKVSIEQPREKVSVAESANEERYTRAPTLPMKDYPDVIVQTPERRKQRTKKAKAPKVQKLEREVSPSDMAIITGRGIQKFVIYTK
jgi:hypothetical protein